MKQDPEREAAVRWLEMEGVAGHWSIFSPTYRVGFFSIKEDHESRDVTRGCASCARAAEQGGLVVVG